MADAALQQHRWVFEQVNIRSVVSVPVISKHGTFCGMLAVHKPTCGRPAAAQFQLLQQAGTESADRIVLMRTRRKR
jgi:hypothetical protein